MPAHLRLFETVKENFMATVDYATWDSLPAGISAGVEEACALLDYVSRYGRGTMRGKLPQLKMRFIHSGERSFQSQGGITLDLGGVVTDTTAVGYDWMTAKEAADYSRVKIRKIMLHEYGHVLEHTQMEYHEVGKRFLLERGDVTRATGKINVEHKLRDLVPNSTYAEKEIALVPGKESLAFSDPYVGKLYYRTNTMKSTIDLPDGVGPTGAIDDLGATEVISMGMESLDQGYASNRMWDMDHVLRSMGVLNNHQFQMVYTSSGAEF